MAVITGGRIIEGTYEPYFNAGAPVAGTDAVQTITIGGTPTGGTFRLRLDGFDTAAITWSATNATLVANIDAALEALPNVGAGGVVTAVGTMTAGIGTITLTFSGGNLTKQVVNLITVSDNSMTGTSPTAAVAMTTAGVASTARGIPPGGLLIDTTNSFLYINTGTALSPTFTKVGTQT